MDIGVCKEDLPELKNRYNKAIKNGNDTFMFNNVEILVGYAKYLIEYLETIK